MALRNLQELLRGTRRFATSLLPLFQRAFGNPQRSRKLRLRKSALQPHANDLRFGLYVRSFASASFDLPYTVQDFLPHVAFGLELGQCLSSQLLTHLGMPLTTASKYAQGHPRAWFWRTASASRTRSAGTVRSR